MQVAEDTVYRSCKWSNPVLQPQAKFSALLAVAQKKQTNKQTTTKNLPVQKGKQARIKESTRIHDACPCAPIRRKAPSSLARLNIPVWIIHCNAACKTLFEVPRSVQKLADSLAVLMETFILETAKGREEAKKKSLKIFLEASFHISSNGCYR